MREFFDISYTLARHEQQKLDIYLPDSENFTVMLYFHGGGLNSGSRKHDRQMADFLCANNIALISADYRMYPEAHYPDFLWDAAAAVAWVKKHIGEYGNCERLYVGGSSAGGYISMMLCFDPKYLAPYGLKPTDIDGYIHDAGQPTAHFNVLRERGLDFRRVIIDESAPLYHIGNAAEYAPMLFIVSDNDMAGRLEQTELVLATLRHFGYDQSKISYRLMHGTHCAYLNAKAEDGVCVLAHEIVDYIVSQR